MRLAVIASILVVCLITSLAVAGQITSSQIVGSWVHTNTADMQALEFTKDGKVRMYYGAGSDAMLADYTILDDGRLSLNLGGMETFFLPSLSGDQLQLKAPDSGNVSQYRRLKPGETIAAGLTAQGAADQKSVQDRNAAIPTFLQRHDLVMLVINGGQGAPAPCALEFAPNATGFVGRAVYNSTPLKVDALTVQITSSDNPIARITFSPTPSQPNGTSQIDFHAIGQANDMTLTAAVNFNSDAFANANATAVIKSDADMHKQILDRAQGEVARLNAQKAPVVALLNDYAVIKGRSQSSNPNEHDGYTDQFTLARNPQNNTWVGQGQLMNVATGAADIFPVVAAVGIVNQKPAIQITSQKRVYLLTTIDTAGGKLTGVWQMPGNPAPHAAELSIAQAVDAKAAQELFATRKTALQQLPAGAVYHALLNDQYTNGTQPPNPVAVTFTSTTAGAITGKAEYALEGCTMTLIGKEIDTPLGPQLRIQYTSGQANPVAWGDVKAFIDLVQHEAWVLSPTEDASGAMRLSGYAVANPTAGAMPISLQLIPYTAADKTAITQALSSGTQFKVVNPGGIQAPDDILQFATDPATNKITGHIVAGGAHLGLAVGITFAGDITDQSGWAKLTMPINRSPTDHRTVYAYTIVVTPTDAGVYLNACMYNIAQGPTRAFSRWDAVQVKQ